MKKTKQLSLFGVIPEPSKEELAKYKWNLNNLERHNYLYHVEDNPEISDEEYDKLFLEVSTFEEKYPQTKLKSTKKSPTQTVGAVGGKVLSSLEQKAHNSRMYGLDNVFSIEDFKNFKQKMQNIISHADLTFFADLKLDGLACELVYKQGKLDYALTRGDGIIGEDVTEAIRLIKNIPQELTSLEVPNIFEVRGEILFFTKDFEELNEKQQALNLPLFKTARNAAAGTLRQLDLSKVASRPLHFLAYSTTFNGKINNISWETQADTINNLRILGFHSASVYELCSTTEQASNFYSRIEEQRDSLPYEIDGIVYKINDLHLQEALGYTARAPRFAFAWKFASRKAYTQLKAINIQVGRTGVLTPVAELEPVLIGGVTVSSATLHNEDEITKLDLHIGDTVLLERAGDVIPKIIEVDKSKRPENAKSFVFPHTCPICQSPAFREEGDAAWYCLNLSCPQIRIRAIQHFVGKSGLDISGIGSKWIERLVEKKDIENFADLFKLTMSQLLQYDGVKEKSAENFLTSISDIKETATLQSFISALGIRHIGEQTALTLAKHFQNIDNLIEIASSRPSELLNLQDIGTEVSQSLHAFFLNEDNRKLIQELQALGLNPQYNLSTNQATSNALEGKKILFTGTLSQPRSYFEKLVEENNGHNAQSVSKNLDILVAGEKAGSKLDKAQSLGITVLNEEEFLKLLK